MRLVEKDKIWYFWNKETNETQMDTPENWELFDEDSCSSDSGDLSATSDDFERDHGSSDEEIDIRLGRKHNQRPNSAGGQQHQGQVGPGGHYPPHNQHQAFPPQQHQYNQYQHPYPSQHPHPSFPQYPPTHGGHHHPNMYPPHQQYPPPQFNQHPPMQPTFGMPTGVPPPALIPISQVQMPQQHNRFPVEQPPPAHTAPISQPSVNPPSQPPPPPLPDPIIPLSSLKSSPVPVENPKFIFTPKKGTSTTPVASIPAAVQEKPSPIIMVAQSPTLDETDIYADMDIEKSNDEEKEEKKIKKEIKVEELPPPPSPVKKKVIVPAKEDVPKKEEVHRGIDTEKLPASGFKLIERKVMNKKSKRVDYSSNSSIMKGIFKKKNKKKERHRDAVIVIKTNNNRIENNVKNNNNDIAVNNKIPSLEEKRIANEVKQPNHANIQSLLYNPRDAIKVENNNKQNLINHIQSSKKITTITAQEPQEQPYPTKRKSRFDQKPQPVKAKTETKELKVPEIKNEKVSESRIKSHSPKRKSSRSASRQSRDSRRRSRSRRSSRSRRRSSRDRDRRRRERDYGRSRERYRDRDRDRRRYERSDRHYSRRRSRSPDRYSRRRDRY